jgi:hypothetical protein
MKITELRDRRETYGHDGRAINKHSIRVYETSGVRRRGAIEFFLNRTLDGCPPFYELYYFEPNSFLPTYLNVNGVQYWGGGLSWREAERQAFGAIKAFLSR